MTDYQYTNLTAAIGDKGSPLRLLLSEMLPHTRHVQAEYRASKPRLLVEGGSSNPGTLGAAFDYAMRFELLPSFDARLARAAFIDDADAVANIDAVIVAAQVARVIGDRTTVYRASWALALLTEVYRVGMMHGSPLRLLRDERAFDAMHLLELAPRDAIRQLRELVELASTELLPHLQEPYTLGPTFDGSELCAADADVISNGLLLDFKTSLGAKVSRPGGRSDCLKIKDLYQVVAYALFDHSDSYLIHRVGFYSARFGHLVSWDLVELVEKLAGRPVDLADARERVWRSLGGAPSFGR